MAKRAETDLKPLHKGTRKLAGAKGRTIDQKEADLATVADLLTKGWTHHNIAVELCRIHGDEKYISRSSVTEDANLLLRRWRQYSALTMDEMKGEHLARLQKLEAYAWERLETLMTGGASKTTSKVMERHDGIRRRGEVKPPRVVSKAETKGNADTTATWVRTIQWCSEQRAKILGLYAPLRLAAGGGGDGGHMDTGGAAVTLTLNISSEKTLQELTAFPILEAEVETVNEDEE